jgi:drug/metabolite transporter (DMT)-like permease
MFFIPLIIYLILAANTPTRFALSPFEYLLILIQGIFFSYLGNVFSLRGIELAPNPGYSLIISKSYVVFTAVASIFIFSAPLTIKSVIAIIFIILFSAMLTIDKGKTKANSSKLWLPYTLGAFFCSGLLALSTKYLFNLGVPILTRLIYSMLVVTVLIFGEMLIKKIAVFSLSKAQIVTLVFIGIFGSSYIYFMQVGFLLAPNVGFVNAANAGSISLLTLMSALIFKDELRLKKMIGIIGVTVGLLILFL